jgi:hypothetical protein
MALFGPRRLGERPLRANTGHSQTDRRRYEVIIGEGLTPFHSVTIDP